MKQEYQLTDHIFCFNQDEPKSLVILTNRDRVLDLLLTSSQQTAIIWIIPELTSQFCNQIRKIQSELGMNVLQYQSLNLLQSHMKEKRIMQKLVIICSPEMKTSAAKLIEIKNIVLYPSQECLDVENSNQSIYYAEEEYQLLNILRVYKEENNKLQYKLLPNFLNLNNQASTSNTMIRCLWSMIKNQIDQATRSLIIDELSKLIQSMQQIKSSPYSTQFIEQLRKGQLSCKRSLYWYTLQSLIFKLVNNLLRSTQQPCILFYIQPYFKSLFNSITSLYLQKKSHNRFICYRGGQVTKQELDCFYGNLGGIVQNLGFLSTSLDKQVAQRYAKNVFFQIIVNDAMEQSSQACLGYAIISQFSNYYSESEVLFNPLNFFSILSIKEVIRQQQSVYNFELQFIPPKRFQNPSVSLNQDKKLACWLIKKQNDYKNYTTCQGHALQLLGKFRDCRLIYWKKFNELAQYRNQKYKTNQKQPEYNKIQNSSVQKQNEDAKSNYILGLTQCAGAYQSMGQYQRAIKLLNLAEKSVEQNKNSILYITTLSKIARFYFQYSDYEKSLQVYLKQRQIIINKFGLRHNLYADSLKNIALILIQKDQLQQAVRFYEQSKHIKQKLFGPNNFQQSQILNGMSENFRKKGDLSKAILIQWESLNIVQRVYGIDSYYANLLGKLAQLYYEKGEFKKSLQICKKSLEIKLVCYGQDHIQVAKILSIVAINYLIQLQFKAALYYYQKSNEILKKCGEQKSIFFTYNVLNIGQIYMNWNNLDKTLSYLQSIRQAYFKTNTKSMQVNLLNFISEAYLRKGQLDKAMEILRQAQLITTDLSKHNKLPHAQILYTIASVYHKMGNLQEALQKHKQSLTIMRCFYGSENFNFYKNLIAIARIQTINRNFSKVNFFVKEAEAIVLKFYGISNPSYLELTYVASKAQETRGLLNNALNIQLRYLKMNQTQMSNNRPSYCQILKGLAKILKSMGSYSRGLKINKKTLRVFQLQVNNLESEVDICKQIINTYISTADKQLATQFLRNNKAYFNRFLILKTKNQLSRLFQKSSVQISPTANFVDF